MEKKTHNSRNKITGVTLIVFTAAILGAIAFFLFQKYSQPPSLAKILPADETLFFTELRTNVEDPTWKDLQQIFAGSSPVEISNIDSLGFANTTDFLALLNKRIGIAFLGESLDSQRFLLALDVLDVNTALNFLEAQTLENESLASENYLHQKIYFYPQSRELAFFFYGNDLILASSLKDLEAIARVIHGSSENLKNSAKYQAVIQKLNPRETVFVYFSEKLIQQIFISNLEGMRNALATPLLDLFESGGTTLTSSGEGLQLTTQLALKNKYSREQLFAEVEEVNSKTLNLLGEETKSFWAAKNSTAQLTHFLSASKEKNPAFPILLKNLAEKFTREWLGEETSFSKEIAPLFESTSVLGQTNSGGFFGILENADSEALLVKLEKSNGKLAARQKLVELPDTTPGHELIVDNEPETVEELFASHKITTLKFPNYELSFAKLDNLLVFANENEVLEKMIARFVAEEKVFENLLTESEISAGNIFYTRVDDSENPLLQPFRFTLAGMDFGVDGVRMKLFLGK